MMVAGVETFHSTKWSQSSKALNQKTLWIISFHHISCYSDGSHAESALTKVEDGTFSLHKSLLNRSNGHNDTNTEILLGDLDNPPQSPSLWKKSPDSIANYIENKRIEGLKEREENEAAARDLNDIWDSSLKESWNNTSQCNFGNERYAFISQPSIHIPINPSLPQSIAVDGKRIFVGDVFNSAVYFFFDTNFRGRYLNGYFFCSWQFLLYFQEPGQLAMYFGSRDMWFAYKVTLILKVIKT